MEFVMTMALTPERKLAREDAGKVIDSLKEHGFFVQLPPQKESNVRVAQRQSNRLISDRSGFRNSSWTPIISP